MTKCTACGAELGIGYAEWERPLNDSYYLGIDRNMYGQNIKGEK